MSTSIVNTHEAKTRLSELIREVERGGEVIVARNGEPVAKLIAWPPAKHARVPGSWAGKMSYGDSIVGSDDDVLDLFDESGDESSLADD